MYARVRENVHRTSSLAVFGKSSTHAAGMKRTRRRTTASLSDSSHGRSEIGVENSVAKYAYVLNSPTLRIGLVRYGSRLSHRDRESAVTTRNWSNWRDDGKCGARRGRLSLNIRVNRTWSVMEIRNQRESGCSWNFRVLFSWRNHLRLSFASRLLDLCRTYCCLVVSVRFQGPQYSYYFNVWYCHMRL